MIVQCYSDNLIRGKIRVGGLAGSNYATILNSYTFSDIEGKTNSREVGGFIGYSVESVVQNCFAAGTLWGANIIGGFAGSSTSDNFTHCLWASNTYSNCSFGVGNLLTDPTQIISQTTMQMRHRDAYIGWDFLGENVNGENEIWRMCADGVYYPRLSWEFARSGDFACGDGTDILDLFSLAQNWLSAADLTPTIFNYACDANGDGEINLEDFGFLANKW